MATYQIHINERMAPGKNLVTFLKSIHEVVSFEISAKKATQEKSALYKDLECAFRDVREILDGKQKKQTLDEFLYELRNNPD